MFHYLELDWDEASFQSFQEVEFNGAMGDQVGRRRYSHLATEPIEKWMTVINNPLRKWWSKRYLRWLGPKRLEIMGYEQTELFAAIDAAPSSGKRILADALAMIYGWFYASFELPMLRRKWIAWRQNKKYVAHR